MLPIILTLAFWLLVTLLSEALWRKNLLRGEYTRKLVHIVISLSTAVTPFYLSWSEIQLIGILGMIVAALARVTGFLRGPYDIKRKSWGELIGPTAIVIITLFEPPRILFVAVMLNTGLADGLAAIIGTRFGKSNQYKIFGYTKSVAGTAAFYITSLCSMLGVVYIGHIAGLPHQLGLILLVPLLNTIIENISVFGVDNASITFMTALLFAILS